MSQKKSDKESVSRRGFLTGVTVGSVGAIVGREAIAQEFIDTGLTLDDLAGEWWLDDIPGAGNGGGIEVTPPVETDPPFPTAQPALRVRRDIYTLPDGGREIQSLRRGIAEMKRRSAANPGDPTGWFFQANIHAGSAASQLQRCQHGNRFFLSWHRMYLYFFERILRSAANDDSLTLPFWNYSVSGRASLPRTFIVPRDENANPLYWANREETFNRGGALPSNLTDVNETLNARSFDGRLGFNQVLERGPHNGVHGMIGGSMGLVNEAGRDPIFWMHHCNVDRLWNQWLGRGGSNRNPTDIDFIGQRFNFYDENRQLVSMTGQQILDTRTLGYRYEDDPAEPIGSSAFVVASNSTAPSGTQIEGFGDAGPAPVNRQPSATLAVARSDIRLGSGRTKVALRVDIPPARQISESVTSVTAEGLTEVSEVVRTLAAPTVTELFTTSTNVAEISPVVLQLQDINFENPPGVFNIFVNLPDGTAPEPQGPYYAGYFAPFAQNEYQPGEADSYDITALLNRQIARGLWDGEEIDVQFIAIGPDGSVTQVVRDAVSIGRIRIIRE